MIITNLSVSRSCESDQHKVEISAIATSQEAAELSRTTKLLTDSSTELPKSFKIKNIYYSNKPGKEKVILVFEDGTRITKTMLPGDKFDLNIGVALAFMEKVFESRNRFHKMVQSKLPKVK